MGAEVLEAIQEFVAVLPPHGGDNGIAGDDSHLERTAHHLYPAGYVDGIADDREFESPASPDVPERHFAKMQSDARLSLARTALRRNLGCTANVGSWHLRRWLPASITSAH